MRRWRTLPVGCGALIGVWLLTAVGVWLARAYTPCAEKVLTFVQAQPLAGKSQAERASFIDALAEQLNLLDSDERRKVQLSSEIRALYPQLTIPEQRRYLDSTYPPGMREMVKAFDRMPADKRRRNLGLAIDDLDLLHPGNRDRMKRDGTNQRIDRIVEQGLGGLVGNSTAATGESSPTTELELQPFVEQTQHVMQMAR